MRRPCSPNNREFAAHFLKSFLNVRGGSDLKHSCILLVLALFSFFAIQLGFCEEPSPDSLENILQKMQERSQKTQTLRADFRLERYSNVFEETTVKSGRIYYSKPKRFRMDILKPYEKTYYANENQVVEYIPDSKLARCYALKPGEEKPLAQDSARKGLPVGVIEGPDELKKYFSLTLVGPETIENENYALLMLVPKDESVETDYKKVLLWVRLKDAFPVRLQGLTEDDTDTYKFSKIEVNSKLRSDLFEFKPPQGVTVEYVE